MAVKSTLRTQLRRARKRYMGQPSNRHLRWYLNARGRLGLWDKRMHAYYGVDPRVNKRCRQAIARAYAAGLVPTSTTGGTHSKTSMHYSGNAVDLGTRRGEPTSRKARFQKAEFNAWQNGRRPGLVELIGPDNYRTVLRGMHSPLPEGDPLEQQHDDHVHMGFHA